MVGEDESYDLAHFEFIMRAYRAARPPHAEGLAVWIAGHLAHRS